MSRQNSAPILIALSRVFSVCLGLANTLYIARLLGPEGRGITSAALSLFYMVPLLTGLGVPLVVRRLASLGLESPAILTARTWALITTFPSLCFGILTVYMSFSSEPKEVILLILAGSASAGLTVSWLCDQSVLIASGRYDQVALLQLLPSVVLFIVNTVSSFSGMFSISTVLIGSILGTLATWAFGRTRVKATRLKPRYQLKVLVQEGIGFAGAQAAEAGSIKLDQIILLPLLGASALGHYSVAATLSTTSLALGYSISSRFFSDIARSSQQNLPQLLQRAMRTSLIWGIIAGFATAGVAQLIPFVFGIKFTDAVAPTLVLSVGVVFLVGNQVATSLLAALGKSRNLTLAQVSSLMVGLIAQLCLSPILGVFGAAAGATIGYVAGYLIFLRLMNIQTSTLAPTMKQVSEAIKDVTSRH